MSNYEHDDVDRKIKRTFGESPQDVAQSRKEKDNKGSKGAARVYTQQR